MPRQLREGGKGGKMRGLIAAIAVLAATLSVIAAASASTWRHRQGTTGRVAVYPVDGVASSLQGVYDQVYINGIDVYRSKAAPRVRQYICATEEVVELTALGGPQVVGRYPNCAWARRGQYLGKWQNIFQGTEEVYRVYYVLSWRRPNGRYIARGTVALNNHDDYQCQYVETCDIIETVQGDPNTYAITFKQ
jgi:hypothetical protein